MGSGVGAGDGAEVGAAVGPAVGAADGEAVGAAEGEAVGATVGAGVGTGVGHGKALHGKSSPVVPHSSPPPQFVSSSLFACVLVCSYSIFVL